MASAHCRVDRASTFSSGLAQPTLYPLFDGDMTTTVDWPRGRPLFGWNPTVGSPLEVAATHVVFGTTDVDRLKGTVKLSGRSGAFEFNLEKLRDAGRSSVYRVAIPGGEVELLPRLPESVPVPTDPDISSFIDGEKFRLDNPARLASFKPRASRASWRIENGMACLRKKPGARSVEGTLTVPGSLPPGHTVAVRFDNGYAMWQGGYSSAVKLGTSLFRLEEARFLDIPGRERYVAASFVGHGPVIYSMFLTRGRGASSGRITWAVTGRGGTRGGVAELNAADARVRELPIEIGVVKKWRWRWFNHDHMKNWEIRLEEVRVVAVAVGTLTRALPGVAAARRFAKPDSSTPDRRWFEKRKKKGLPVPAFSPDPLAGTAGAVMNDELDQVCAVLDYMPLPKSNSYCDIIWGQAGPMEKISRLLDMTGDRRLLDWMVLWCERVLEYRNGGDKSSVPLIASRIPRGMVLPGWSVVVMGGMIDDADLADLEHLPWLRELYLANTGVTDLAVPNILISVRLEVLDLSGTKITNSGLQQLGQLVNLRLLYLHDTPTTAHGRASLTVQLPDLEIRHEGHRQ